MVSVWRSTSVMRRAKIETSRISTRPSRQLSTAVSGSMTNKATNAAQCSRKKVSQMPPRLSEPSDMTFSARPECFSMWKSSGQREHVLEEFGHHREPAPMRNPIGVERDEGADPDIEGAETDPQGKLRQEARPAGDELGGLRRRERVDDAPEQDRLGELRRRERNVGDREKRADGSLRAKGRERAPVKPDEFHEAIIPARSKPASQPQLAPDGGQVGPAPNGRTPNSRQGRGS